MHRPALAFLAFALAAWLPISAQYVPNPSRPLRTLFDVTEFLNNSPRAAQFDQVITVCTSGELFGSATVGTECDYSNVREAVEAANAIMAAQVAGLAATSYSGIVVEVLPTKPLAPPAPLQTWRRPHYYIDQPFTISKGVILRCVQGAASQFNDGSETILTAWGVPLNGTPIITLENSAIEGCKIKAQPVTAAVTADTALILSTGSSYLKDVALYMFALNGGFDLSVVDVTSGFLYIYGSILSATDDSVIRLSGTGSVSMGWSFLKGLSGTTTSAVKNSGTGVANVYFVRLGNGADDTDFSAGKAWNNLSSGAINVIHSPHPSAGTAGVDWWDRFDSRMDMTIADSGDGSPAALSIDPLSRTCLITCNDADGCAITILETSSKPAQNLTIINAGASNNLTIAESAGVVALTAASITLTPDDVVNLRYSAAKWVQAGTVQVN